MRASTGLSWALAVGLGVGCGGDDGSGSDAPASTSDGSTSGGSTDGGDESSTAAAEGSTDGGSSSDGADSSDDAPVTGSSDGGGVEDPEYPNPGGGGCQGSQFPVTLPEGSVCAPMCTGEGDTCPDGASGDAVPTCTPFEDEGGSGDACTDSTTCPDGEACGIEGTCVAVAFWACRLLCQGGETCPDGMTCTVAGTCGYD